MPPTRQITSTGSCSANSSVRSASPLPMKASMWRVTSASTVVSSSLAVRGFTSSRKMSRHHAMMRRVHLQRRERRHALQRTEHAGRGREGVGFIGNRDQIVVARGNEEAAILGAVREPRQGAGLGGKLVGLRNAQCVPAVPLERRQIVVIGNYVHVGLREECFRIGQRSSVRLGERARDTQTIMQSPRARAAALSTTSR